MPSFVPVAKVSEIPDPGRMLVEVDERLVVLIHTAGHFYAIDDVCTHDGGPLDEGEFFHKDPEGLCVECPWHQSVYAMKDGSVVHGPSTYEVAGYEAQIRDGQVEIRLAQPKPVEQEDSRQAVGELMTEG